MSLTINKPSANEVVESSLVRVSGTTDIAGEHTITATYATDPDSGSLADVTNKFALDASAQGMCTDGTVFYETNSTEIKKRNAAGTVLSSSTDMGLLWDDEALTSCGDMFFKDGFIYLCGYKNTAGTSFVFKVNPANFTAVDKWDISSSFTNSVNVIFYHDSHWFIGEACQGTSQTTFVKAFDDDFAFVKNSYSNTNDYGFQGGMMYQDKMILTDHTNFYVCLYNNDQTFTDLYTVTPSPAQQVQGLTSDSTTFYYVHRNEYLKTFTLNEVYTYGAISSSGDLSTLTATATRTGAGDFEIFLRASANNYQYLKCASGANTDEVAFNHVPQAGEKIISSQGALMTNTNGALETT